MTLDPATGHAPSRALPVALTIAAIVATIALFVPAHHYYGAARAAPHATATRAAVDDAAIDHVGRPALVLTCAIALGGLACAIWRRHAVWRGVATNALLLELLATLPLAMILAEAHWPAGAAARPGLWLLIASWIAILALTIAIMMSADRCGLATRSRHAHTTSARIERLPRARMLRARR